MHPIYAPELVRAVAIERQYQADRAAAAARARGMRRRQRLGWRGRRRSTDHMN